MVSADDRVSKPVDARFDLLATRHMVVKVTINNSGPYRMIFDTGSPVSILNTRTAKEAGLLSKTATGGGFSLFGSLDQVKVKELRIGKLRANNVSFMVMDHPAVEMVSKSMGPVEGIIGFPFFARYRMTLDYQSKELTFIPNGYEPTDILQALTDLLSGNDKPPVKVLSSQGLWGFAVENGKDEQPGVRVSRVMQDSPAGKAGLLPGDQLLNLDDSWTDSIADCYRAAANVKPGTPVKLRVLRSGKEIRLIITPEFGL
jgi:hypothetical protein